MKNQKSTGLTNLQEESIWQITKPTNPWTPNIDHAWNNVSLKMSTASTTFNDATPFKTISKIAIKKSLLWITIGAGITIGSLYFKMVRKEEKPISVIPKTSIKIIPQKSNLTVENQTEFRPETKKSQKNTTYSNPIAETKNNTAPNSKILQFKQTELQVVTEIINQTYGVNIKIEKNQLLHCKLTATFDNEPLQNILEIIQETFNMEIVPEKEAIWLKGGSCQ